jgi:hypothetical protein
MLYIICYGDVKPESEQGAALQWSEGETVIDYEWLRATG